MLLKCYFVSNCNYWFNYTHLTFEIVFHDNDYIWLNNNNKDTFGKLIANWIYIH